MIQGSCLCGAVRYELDEQAILLMNNCHCSRCRKVSGATFATFVQVAGKSFRWISGENSVATFESSPGFHRAFCKLCGSRAPQSRNWEEHVTIPAGGIDGDPGVKPHVNICVSDKVAWHVIDESIPSAADAGSREFWRKLIREKQSKG
jgi:hypothetical protein